MESGRAHARTRNLEVPSLRVGPGLDTADTRQLGARWVLRDVMEGLLIVGSHELVHVE